MWRRISAFLLTLITAGCLTPTVNFTYTGHAILKHTYAIYIEPADAASAEFCNVLKETLKWEGYLYLPDCKEDADTVMKLKSTKTPDGFKVELTFTEKGNSPQKVYITIKAPDIKDAARVLAYHFQEIVELPPDVEAGTVYYNLTDPSAEAR